MRVPITNSTFEAVTRGIIEVDDKGVVYLPPWLITRLLRGLRSKKRRQQKKRVKKRFLALIKEEVKNEKAVS